MKSGPCSTTVFKLHFAGRKTPVVLEMLGVIVLPGMVFADNGFGEFSSVSDALFVLSDAMAEAAGELADHGF